MGLTTNHHACQHRRTPYDADGGRRGVGADGWRWPNKFRSWIEQGALDN
jgi:hypothetical protein